MEHEAQKKLNILFKWKAPEFIKQEKTILWDAGVFVAALLFFLWGLWAGDITLMVLAILGGGLFWHFGVKEPKEITFAIRRDGVQVGDLLYKYKILESYWIFHEPPRMNELVLRSKKVIIPLIHINLAKEDPEKVREALKGLLKEKEESYPISHVLAHIIGY